MRLIEIYNDFSMECEEIDMIEEGKQDSVALTQNLNRRSIIKNNMQHNMEI